MVYLKPVSPVARANYILSVFRVKRVIHEINPDILHSHYATSYGLLGALSRFHPFVCTAWGTDVLVSPKSSLLYKHIVKTALSSADLVTSMAEHMTEEIFKLSIAPEKVITLPFGIDDGLFNPRSENEVESGENLIVSTRNLEAIYNVQLLLKAMPFVLLEVPDARCMIVGNGSLRHQLELLADDLKISKNVEFLGTIPQQEISGILKKAGVFVSTSLSDGNNISLNEAMACGCYPVVTDIAANREWVTDGFNGDLVPTSDPLELARKIVFALKTPDRRFKAAQENWRRIQQKGLWNVNMAKMERYYSELVGG